MTEVELGQDHIQELVQRETGLDVADAENMTTLQRATFNEYRRRHVTSAVHRRNI